MRKAAMLKELQAQYHDSLRRLYAAIGEVNEHNARHRSDPPMARDARDSEPDSDDVVMSVDVHAAH